MGAMEGNMSCENGIASSNNIAVLLHQEDGYWAPWAEWSSCTLSCVREGGRAGAKTRSRECIPPKNGGDPCEGQGTEDDYCPWKDGNLIHCPINHSWKEWGSFTQCSATCGERKRYRYRSCTEGRHGGTPCPRPSEQDSQSCGLPDCPPARSPDTERQEDKSPDSIVLSSTAETAERQGGRLGEFVRMGKYNNRPYYKQEDTEGSEDLYMYYMSDGWWVGDTLGRSFGFLRNRQDTDLPPRANWLNYNKKWLDDDRTLKLEYTTLSPCKLVRVAGSGRVLDHQSSRMGDYRLQEGRWSEGRPVYKKGSGSTALFLLVAEGFSAWTIQSSTTAMDFSYYYDYYYWIASGRATNSPTSSRAGGNRRKGVTRWRYWDGDNWLEGNISVTCN